RDRSLQVTERCQQDLGWFNGRVRFGFGCGRISQYTQQYCRADSLPRCGFPCGLRQTSARRTGLLVCSPAQSRDLDQRDLLGVVALSLWASRLSLRFSAAVPRCLAHDQLFRLRGSERDGVILSRLLRSRVQMGAAGPVWRTGDHAVASDQGREGANRCKHASTSDGWSCLSLGDEADSKMDRGNDSPCVDLVDLRGVHRLLEVD